MPYVYIGLDKICFNHSLFVAKYNAACQLVITHNMYPIKKEKGISDKATTNGLLNKC